MNTAVRAHRILAALANYQAADKTKGWPPALSGSQLGEPIGRYCNPGPQDETIGIFTHGLSWFDSGNPIQILFADIAEIALPDGKESDWLLLKLRNDKQFKLPIKGRHGRFLDSMEMLRFLDRVIHDLQA